MFDHHVREKNLRYLNYLEIDVSTMSPRIDLAAWLLLLPEDHNVAAILIAPSIGVAPAGHHTFEEAFGYRQACRERCPPGRQRCASA